MEHSNHTTSNQQCRAAQHGAALQNMLTTQTHTGSGGAICTRWGKNFNASHHASRRFHASDHLHPTRHTLQLTHAALTRPRTKSDTSQAWLLRTVLMLRAIRGCGLSVDWPTKLGLQSITVTLPVAIAPLA